MGPRFGLRISNVRSRSKELADAIERAKQSHEQRIEPLVKVLLEDIAVEAANMTSEVRALWDDAGHLITELQNVTERMFDILRQQSQHNDVILKLLDEINTAFEYGEARVQIYAKYREWVGDLRDYLTDVLSEKFVGRNYSLWGQIAKDIRKEQKTKAEALRRGKPTPQCVITDALKAILATHNLTLDELQAVLHMKENSNTTFHRAENETSEAAIAALEHLAFPPDLRPLKDVLRKTIQA
ncbi:uncharacterized protein EV422DRAFT_319583 [Fimicolochytrium jonesii]|uniref:uncharacterized protein n=1 Tax=Fimicolochytrium jonesii TaxID=1396493 RepID=UPI0022FF00C0|nr:uncharacterized protein EV422DRAFT_319583 [Fimicolochytrium jonesii]KAI8824410.1 hypothetical protein EV422DRAFT_319583 [Fimicolochytrium jonesii]